VNAGYIANNQLKGRATVTTKTDIANDERVQRARQRAIALAESQGKKPLSREDLLALGWSEPDPEFRMDEWLRDLRREGRDETR